MELRLQRQHECFALYPAALQIEADFFRDLQRAETGLLPAAGSGTEAKLVGSSIDPSQRQMFSSPVQTLLLLEELWAHFSEFWRSTTNRRSHFP